MNGENKKTILLVEDEAILAITEKLVLEKYGYNVITADSGEKAIEHFNKNKDIDLILMDIDLGKGLDGTETAAIILKDQDIPVVFLSSHTEPAVVEKTENITSYGYVVKSSSITVLDASIKMAFKLFKAKRNEQMKEAILQESEEKYRLLHESAGLGISYYSLDGMIYSYNQHASKNMNGVPEDFNGKSIYDIFPKSDADFYLDRIKKAALSEDPVTYDDMITLPIGIKYFLSTFTRIVDKNKKILGIQIIFQDITNIKSAEEELRQREALLNKIFDVLPVGLWLADKNGKLTRSNAKGREIWGAEPLVGQEEYGVFKARYFPSGKELAPQDWALAHTIQSGVTVMDEMLEIDTFDGKKRVILNYTAPVFDKPGQVDGAIIVNLDVTERVQMEDEIKRRNEELAAANEELENSNEELMAANEEIITANRSLMESEKELIESRERFKALHNASFGGIAIHDKGIILECNQGLADMTGYSVEELTGGLDGLLLISEKSRNDVMDKIQSGYEKPYEAIGLRKNGEQYPLRLEARNVPYKGQSLRTVEFRDITDQKFAEKTIIEEKQFLEDILMTTSDGFWVVNKDKKIILVNDTYCKMSGYLKEEILALSIKDLDADENPVDTVARIERIIKNGYELFETKHRRKDGSLFDVEISSTLSELYEGCFICFCRDITERKRLGNELSETKNYLENLLNYANAPIIVWDTNYKITIFNKAFERISGRLSVDVIGKHIDILFPVETREQSLVHIQEATVGKRWEVVEIGIGHVNGAVYTLLWNSAAIYMSDGKTIRSIIAQGHDITIRTQLANELKKSEEKYKALFMNVSDAIFVYDADTFIITEVNDATSRLYGYEKEELIGMSCLKFSAEVDKSKQVADKIISEGRVDVNFRHHKKKDGTDLYLHLSGHKITVDGKVFTFSVCRDITERKAYEDNIRNLLQEKELTLKEVHHRLKNNMNTVKGLLTLQAMSLNDPPAISALNDTISRVDSMVVLYDTLYCSHNFNDISVLTYLPSLIDEIIANFPGSESVKVEKKIDDFILEVKLLQPLGIIINELLANIMKYAFTGRENNLITVSATLTDKKVSIIVSDNGNGIPESVTFENSTGFGMQLVSMLTVQIGGNITIERERERERERFKVHSGIRFALSFPSPTKFSGNCKVVFFRLSIKKSPNRYLSTSTQTYSISA